MDLGNNEELDSTVLNCRKCDGINLPLHQGSVRPLLGLRGIGCVGRATSRSRNLKCDGFVSGFVLKIMTDASNRSSSISSIDTYPFQVRPSFVLIS